LPHETVTVSFVSRAVTSYYGRSGHKLRNALSGLDVLNCSRLTYADAAVVVFLRHAGKKTIGLYLQIDDVTAQEDLSAKAFSCAGVARHHGRHMDL
jgi:hypothetical protein